MKKLFLSLLISFVFAGLYSQDFQVPANYVLDKAEDYSKYENEIIQACNWVISTPINEQAEKRNEVNGFILKWLTGCPYLSIEIKTGIVNFMKPNPDLLMIFMAGWTKYSLETKNFEDKINGNMKGIETVIEFYLNNKENLRKDKNVEKYIDMKESGKLEEYIKANA